MSLFRPLRIAALLLLVAGCAPSLSGPSNSGGLVIVTSDGTQLDDGAADVPPTLDLGVEGDGISASSVSVTLDGRALSLQGTASGVSGRVKPMPYGSAHTLVVDTPSRDAMRIGFHVVDRTSVSAAAWLSPAGSIVCQTVFERAPARAELAAALPGARLTWIDPTHAAIAWASPPPALTIPRGIAAARGSVLDGPLTLRLTGLSRGQLRRATAPAAAPAPASLPLTLWTVTTTASVASGGAHAGQVAVLSPSGWVAEANGSLSGFPSSQVLRAAAASGRPAWPLLQNDFSNPASIDALLNSQGSERRLVAEAVGEVRTLHLGGINLDFESVPPLDEGALTSFVAELAGALHGVGAKLSVDVVPHAPGSVNDASGAYDDPALAALADQLVVMTYDEHYGAGDPGPLAGIDWQAEELAGTLAGVPAGKALLGIPLYARRWSGGEVTSLDYAGAVAQALREPDVAYDYDFGAAAPELTSDPGGVPTQLWFDDADSLLRKIDAVSHLGLAGVAMWRAGFEDPAIWSVL